MNLLLSRMIEAAVLLGWMLTWFVGGYLIIINTLKVKRYETTLLGFGVGLILQVWIANWTGRWMAPMFAFWLSAFLVLAAGAGLTIGFKNWQKAKQALYFPPSYWIVFLVCTYVFLMIGRGLAIMDDYQNLPVTSYLAAGNIPPRFVLNPEVSFDYHYLMLLNAAQWMRIGDLFPWTALDVTRAIFFGLTMVYSAFLGRRLTHSQTAGWLTSIAMAFSGGLRWLLLLFPPALIAKISPHIEMMGSGLSTGETLQFALTQPWQIEGGGPLAFPFAFGSNFKFVSVMGHAGVGTMAIVLVLLIILLYERWHNRWGMLVLSLLLAAIALVSEIWFVFFIFASLVVFFITFLRDRKQLKPEFWVQVGLLIILPGVLSLFQGGVLTGVATGLLSRFGIIPSVSEAQYFSVNFPVRWPPTIISAHFGRLALTNWAQLVVAMLEVGPVFLLIPFYFIWCFKGFRSGKLLYGILAVGTAASLMAVFVEYEGSAGISASARLFIFAMQALALFSVPLLWHWLKRRSSPVQAVVITTAALTLVSGLVYFAIESVAIQEPVLSYFIEPMDASVEDRYWDQLEEDAMVFDFNAVRGVTLFARTSTSYSTWYISLPEYRALIKNPDPYLLNDAGYDYVYLAQEDWNKIGPSTQKIYEDDCVITLYEVSEWTGDFRRVLDISTCEK